MQHRHRRKFSFRFLPFIMIAAILVFGWAVMLLWNGVVSPVLHVEQVSYGQALGLLILCRILSGGFRGPGPRGGRQWQGGPPWRQKWMKMSDEEREKFREQWKTRCGKKFSGDE